jgi:hypothetical protein
MRRPLTTVLVAAVLALSPGIVAAQPARALGVLDASVPFQCWWRSAAGAIRLGEIVEVMLTCAADEADDRRVVPDESRLTVAAIQMAPFEIVGGDHPPDLHSGGRRFFEYRYQLRLIDADVIGRDVKLPPLSIPYRIESRAGAGATLAGRDLVHVMPPLAFRVVSQVPTDATDIRDAGDAGLGRIDALRFRASAFRVAALFLAGLALVVALTALPGILGRLRGGRARRSAGVSEAVVLHTAARRLAEVIDAHPTGDLDAAALADAHHLVRLVAAVALGLGVRQAALARHQGVTEGRVLVRGWLGRARAAVTSNVTAEATTRALDALTPQTSARDRMRLEGLRDALALLTKARYGTEAAPDQADVLAALRVARDAARDLAGERRWRLRPIGSPAAASAVRDLS